MYGGPMGPGPGPHHGSHHGPCHGPHHGPYHGPHGPGPRFYYGGSASVKKIDYMKTIEYSGEGKKYYNSCSCDKCAKPFEIDYRVAQDVTFVSESNLGFKNGNYFTDEKFNGFFMFDIACPECNRITHFFVESKRLPKFVLDGYLKNTKFVRYKINYEFDDFNTDVIVSYETNGTSVKEVYEKINSLYLQNIVGKSEVIPTSLDTINNAIIKMYYDKTRRTIHINKSISKNDYEVNKLRLIKYLLLNNGFKDLMNYKYEPEDKKEEIKILAK